MSRHSGSHRTTKPKKKKRGSSKKGKHNTAKMPLMSMMSKSMSHKGMKRMKGMM